MTDFPDDPDRDALRGIAADGNDLTQPMAIDVTVVVPDQQSAEAIVHAATVASYKASIYRDEADRFRPSPRRRRLRQARCRPRTACWAIARTPSGWWAATRFSSTNASPRSNHSASSEGPGL
jgi:hypothetical protein